MPSLSAKAGYGIRSDFAGEYEWEGLAGVTLSIPLFEGGRNAAKVDELDTICQTDPENMLGTNPICITIVRP